MSPKDKHPAPVTGKTDLCSGQEYKDELTGGVSLAISRQGNELLLAGGGNSGEKKAGMEPPAEVVCQSGGTGRNEGESRTSGESLNEGPGRNGGESLNEGPGRNGGESLTEGPGRNGGESLTEGVMQADGRNRAEEAGKAQDDLAYWNKLAQEQLEASKEGGKDARMMAKCYLIARRITAGDTVPDKDIRYLQKNDQELYTMAMKMRVPKKDPKEYDSVLEEEDQDEDSHIMKVPEGLQAVSADNVTIEVSGKE